MRKTFILKTVAFLALCTVCSAQAAPYTFTKIAETSDGYSNLSRPAVNSSGTVAFSTQLVNGHVFTAAGGAITPVFDGNVKDPSINDQGQLGFISGAVVYRLSAGNLTTIYDGNQNMMGDMLDVATVSNSGDVYFTGKGDIHPEYVKVGNGGAVTTLFSIPSITQFPVFGHPGVSANNHYAVNLNYTGVSLGAGEGGVILDVPGALGTATTYTEPAFPPFPATTGTIRDYGEADINSSGTVVFSGDWNGGFKRLFKFDNGVITSIAFGKAIPAINDQGIVAALFTDGVKSLKAGLGAPTDTILSVGDSFMGSTITDLDFSHEGFSDGNYLAFTATLADGRTGIYLTAVPEPALFGTLAPFLLLARRQRSARR